MAEEVISMKEIFKILKQKISIILICFFVGIGTAVILSWFVLTPKYSARVPILINQEVNENTAVDLNQLNANILLINTCKDIIKSHTVMNAASKELAQDNLFVSKDELRKMISVEQSQNSQMFDIKVIAANPKAAALIANTAAKQFETEMQQIFPENQTTILSTALPNSHPDSPNKKLNVLIGAILGLLLGIGLAILIETLDNTIKDSEFVTQNLELPVLGTITQLTPQELEDAKHIDFFRYRSQNVRQEEPISVEEQAQPRERARI